MPAARNHEQHLIRQQEVLKVLGVTQMTLWRWRNDPKLDFPSPIVVRRRNYYDREELDSWLKRQRCAVLAGGEQ
jgi:predicted DNA-binding transcriptional regulator AlpA